MAESSLAFLLKKLINLVVQEAFVFGEVEEGVKLLQNELRLMQGLLKDADSKRMYNEGIKLWVEQIREVAYDAEDVIALFIVNVDPQRRLQRSKILKFLPTCLVFMDKLHLIHVLKGKIKKINVKIAKINESRSKYDFDTLSPSNFADQERRIIRTTTTVEDTYVVEITDGLDEVKKMLLMSKGEREGDQIMQRKVVSIVGMGGLGKTTLAKKVYNHSDVKHHFDCHAWVCVSQELRLRDLLLNIINSVKSLSEKEKKEMKEMGDEDVGTKLHEYLNHKKYLIVMDDVWSIEAWRCLASYLPDSENGSRVLITIRNKEIAEQVHANPHELDIHTYQLRLMHDGESWELFLRKTFGVMNIAKLSLPNALEDLGRRIVGKCKGLPLAIVVLGGLLSTKEKTVESWRRVVESVDRHLNVGGSQSCLGILALSYDDLPYHLKSCFLYCGIFPGDHEIKARKLISMWIAEGFIERRGTETLEDIGEDYLNELIHRSMVQVAAREVNGRVKSCRIHDLLRDLAVAEARNASLFEVQENIDLISSASPASITVRRLGINHQQYFLLKNNNISQHLHNSVLRSLFFFTDDPIEGKVWRCIKEDVKLLRVLDVFTLEKDIFKGITGELIHLKFLCIKGFHGTGKFPSSIGRLADLQHLHLPQFVGYLPREVWKLQQLRHLYCPWGRISSQCSKLSKWKNGGGHFQLTNLQTLALGAGSWMNGNGLGKLTQLRRLEVRGLTPGDDQQQLFHSIAQLTALRTLTVCTRRGGHDSNSNSTNIEEEEENKLMPGLTMSFSSHIYLYKLVLIGKLDKLPEQTEFYPPNLLKLELRNSELKEHDPMLILGMLPNLRTLRLLDKSFVGRSMTCSPGRFLLLETLDLIGLPEVEELIVEEGAMCNLRSLQICGCKRMEVLPREWGLFRLKKLQNFSLDNCQDLIQNRAGEAPN